MFCVVLMQVFCDICVNFDPNFGQLFSSVSQKLSVFVIAASKSPINFQKDSDSDSMPASPVPFLEKKIRRSSIYAE